MSLKSCQAAALPLLFPVQAAPAPAPQATDPEAVDLPLTPAEIGCHRGI